MNVVVIECWYFFFLLGFIHLSNKVEVILIEVCQNYIPSTNCMYRFISNINEISYNFTENYVLTILVLWVYIKESP